MICLCQTPLTPRATLQPRRRAGMLLTPNCQRRSALSRHTEFTTGLPESCERAEGATHDPGAEGATHDSRVSESGWPLSVPLSVPRLLALRSTPLAQPASE